MPYGALGAAAPRGALGDPQTGVLGQSGAVAPGYWSKVLDYLMTQSWPAQAAQTAYGAVTAPHDAYQGTLDPLSEEAIQRMSDLSQLGPVGALGRTAALNTTAELGIFGGRLAAKNLAKIGENAPQQALKYAEALDKKGVPEAVIRDNVNQYFEKVAPEFGGVSKGADGKWRFEIDDRAAALTPAASVSPVIAGAAEDAFSHPQFFGMYDQPIGKVDVSARSKTYPQGSFRSDTRALEAAGRSSDEAMSVGLHEMQHGAQHAEGFAPGGNPEHIAGYVRSELLKRFDAAMSAGDHDRAMEIGKVLGRVQKGDGLLNYALYRRIAGEAEARNVQTRQHMSPAERRATHPRETQDIPDDLQILLPVTGDASSAPMMASAPIRAYHGSPYDFDKFDMSKIGTGEGEQAYGHGLYFAENPKVAQRYRDALSLQHKGRMYEVEINAAPEQFLDWDKPLLDQPPEMIDRVNALINPALREPYVANVNAGVSGANVYKNYIPGTGAGGDVGASATLREVGIPGIKYLDQGSRATSGGQLLGIDKAADGYRAKIRATNRGGVGFSSPTDIVTTSPAFATEREAQQWADSKINSGSRNYVLFRDDIINIVKKYGIAGAAVMLGLSEAEVQNALLSDDKKPKD